MTQEAFSDNPLMIGYDNNIFEEDLDLGFRFPEGRIITAGGFVPLEEIGREWKRDTGYVKILNMGDSSTSGWDSNRTFLGNSDAHAPFFSYRTYSDLLREDPNFHCTLNAGVPGYTSYQGRKYLERLLKQLGAEGASPDYVTLYFGNNDGTFNLEEDKCRIDFRQASANATGERVTTENFQRNLRDMVELSRDYGAKPIIIVPPVHYDWEAGIRADQHREESLAVIEQMKDTDLGRDLQTARKLWEQGKYKQACERDRYLPRLKQAYRKALLRLAKRTGTDVIDIQREIPFTENDEWFADYCHPLEPANKLIAGRMKAIRLRDVFHKPLRERLFGKREQRTKQVSGIPQDNYTLW